VIGSARIDCFPGMDTGLSWVLGVPQMVDRIQAEHRLNFDDKSGSIDGGARPVGQSYQQTSGSSADIPGGFLLSLVERKRQLSNDHLLVNSRHWRYGESALSPMMLWCTGAAVKSSRRRDTATACATRPSVPPPPQAHSNRLHILVRASAFWRLFPSERYFATACPTYCGESKRKESKVSGYALFASYRKRAGKESWR
jgi:hypothetical protein